MSVHTQRQPVKMAVMIDNIHSIPDWDKQFFEQILQNENFKIIALVMYVPKHGMKLRQLISACRTKKPVSTMLYAMVTGIEKKLSHKKYYSKTFPLFEKMISEVKPMKIPLSQKKGKRCLSVEDLQKIINLQLDVVIHRGDFFAEIFETAKFGVWTLHHADSFNGDQKASFWTVRHHESVASVTLQMFGKKDTGEVISKAFFNNHGNASVNETLGLYHSTNVIIKKLDQLYKLGHVQPDSSLSSKFLSDGQPRIRDVMVYSLFVCKKRFKKFMLNTLAQLNLFRPRCWSVYVGRGSIRNALLRKSVRIIPHRGEFWADPFLFEKSGELFLFFERYNYKTKVGKISVGTLKEGTFKFAGNVLDLDSHHSFPYIFEDKGTIYMIPESSKTNRIEVWISTDFPLKWILSHTAFEGVQSVDTTIFQYNGQWWLFTTHKNPVTEDDTTELYIYVIDGPNLQEIIPHANNPVIIDSRTARNAGRPFIEDGILYRPSQYNAEGIYGRGLNIMKITRLSIDEYEEELDRRIMPDFKKGLFACHHVDQAGGYYVVDACKHEW